MRLKKLFDQLARKQNNPTEFFREPQFPLARYYTKLPFIVMIREFVQLTFLQFKREVLKIDTCNT